MAAGAIIGRIVRGGVDEPAAISEFLQFDDPKPVWTRKRIEACLFSNRELADDRARQLGAFAMIAHEPEHRAVPDPLLPPPRLDPAPPPPADPAPAAAKARHPRRPFDRLEAIRRAAGRAKRKAAPDTNGNPGRLWWKETEAYS